MNKNDVEIEIKFPLNTPQETKQFLNKYAKLVLTDEYQKDIYFTPAHRDFLAVKYPYEWLRLRQTDAGSSITYKHFHPENVKETVYCDEFETPVGDVNTMQKILLSLDFKEIVIIEKTRTSWLLDDVEISIDEVQGLGVFIELEAKKTFSDPTEGKAHLYEVLKRINADVGAEILKGYPRILLNLS